MPTLLITGASRGLGLEFVRQYASDKWDIIAACRTPAKADALQKLAKEHPNIRIESLDVDDANSIQALAGKLKDTPVDLLINNAGIFSGHSEPRSANQGDAGQDFGTIDATAWQKVLFTNTIAPIMLLQAFVPHLTKSKSPKAINITSRMGAIGEMSGGYIAYRSSKAALNAAMRTILSDLTERKIAIANLHPGWVQTDMGGPSATLKPETSISGMRKVIEGLSLANTGKFLSYDGTPISW